MKSLIGELSGLAKSEPGRSVPSNFCWNDNIIARNFTQNILDFPEFQTYSQGQKSPWLSFEFPERLLINFGLAPQMGNFVGRKLQKTTVCKANGKKLVHTGSACPTRTFPGGHPEFVARWP